MSKEEAINHFKLRRKRHDNTECQVCCENKDLYEFDCGDCEHCYCLECYKLMDKCPSCNIPKHPYYQTLFQETDIVEISRIPIIKVCEKQSFNCIRYLLGCYDSINSIEYIGTMESPKSLIIKSRFLEISIEHPEGLDITHVDSIPDL